MSTKAVADCIKAITAAYPGRVKFDASAVQLWVKQLSGIPEQVIADGVGAQIRMNKFPPSIADILDETSRLSCNGRMSAHDAWREMKAMVSRIGPYKDPVWATPEIKRAALATLSWQGGWNREDLDANVSHRARFIQAYESICREIDREMRSPDPCSALNAGAHAVIAPAPLPRDLPPPASTEDPSQPLSAHTGEPPE